MLVVSLENHAVFEAANCDAWVEHFRSTKLGRQSKSTPFPLQNVHQALLYEAWKLSGNRRAVSGEEILWKMRLLFIL